MTKYYRPYVFILMSIVVMYLVDGFSTVIMVDNPSAEMIPWTSKLMSKYGVETVIFNMKFPLLLLVPIMATYRKPTKPTVIAVGVVAISYFILFINHIYFLAAHYCTAERLFR